MNMSPSLVTKLHDNIKFREMFNTQVRECDIQASQAISELFAPYLEEIRCLIAKNDYELGVNPYVDENYKAAREGLPFHQVKMNFMWEPVDCDDPTLRFHDAKFRGNELKYIKRMLDAFASSISLPVVP